MPDTHADARKFRMALGRLWLWAAVAHLLLLALIVLAISLAGLETDYTLLAVLGIIPFAYWVVYGLRFRLAVSSGGLGWMNLGGAQCYLPWAEIARAERRNQLGLPILTVWSVSEGESFHIPLLLTDRDGLRAAVREAAGETHPVTVAISG
jgi:hypothetical protein